MKALAKISIDNIFFIAFYEDCLGLSEVKFPSLGWMCQGDNWLNGMFKKPKYDQTLSLPAWIQHGSTGSQVAKGWNHLQGIQPQLKNIPFWFKKILNSWIWGERKFFKNWGQCLNYCEKNFKYLIHIKYMCFISEVLCIYTINFF